MRGINNVVIAGNVGETEFGKTRINGDEAFSFTVAIEKSDVLWTRANAYGSLALVCRNKMEKGDFVIVEGELMERFNKAKSNKVMEIRCRYVEILKRREGLKDGSQSDGK